MKRYLLIFGFGILGGLSRYGLDQVIPSPHGFPLATLIINLSGCFTFALILNYFPRRFKLSSMVIGAMSAGFIGAFTTFSSFNVDAIELLTSKRLLMFLTYDGLTIFGGIITAWGGLKVSARLVARLERW